MTRTGMSEVEQRTDAVAEAARAAKVRRSAWLLALLAMTFYLGFIAWNVLRAPLGG